MKTDLNLSIAKPCSENWNTFTPSEEGRFCSSCSKVVIDFTTANDREILNFLQKKPAHACGRFKASQLKTYSTIEPVKLTTGFSLLKAGILSLLLILISKPSFSQKLSAPIYSEISHAPVTKTGSANKADHIVKGIVRSEEDGSPIPGVSVVLKGTNVGTQTDMDGKFEFPQRLKQGDVLSFHFIGLKSKEYTIPNQSFVVIELALEMDMDIMGEIAVNEPYKPRQSFLKKAWGRAKSLF